MHLFRPVWRWTGSWEIPSWRLWVLGVWKGLMGKFSTAFVAVYRFVLSEVLFIYVSIVIVLKYKQYPNYFNEPKPAKVLVGRIKIVIFYSKLHVKKIVIMVRCKLLISYFQPRYFWLTLWLQKKAHSAAFEKSFLFLSSWQSAVRRLQHKIYTDCYLKVVFRLKEATSVSEAHSWSLCKLQSATKKKNSPFADFERSSYKKQTPGTGSC